MLKHYIAMELAKYVAIEFTLKTFCKIKARSKSQNDLEISKHLNIDNPIMNFLKMIEYKKLS